MATVALNIVLKAMLGNVVVLVQFVVLMVTMGIAAYFLEVCQVLQI
jgi:hypothetical protein